MRHFALALLLLMMPISAFAQDVVLIYNRYVGWIKEETDAGWAKLKEADASKTKAEGCAHAKIGLDRFSRAVDLSIKLVNALATAGDEEVYNKARKIYVDTDKFYETLKAKIITKCGA